MLKTVRIGDPDSWVQLATGLKTGALFPGLVTGPEAGCKPV